MAVQIKFRRSGSAVAARLLPSVSLWIFLLAANSLRAQQVDAITQVSNLSYLNAKSFGARGDGSTDDTAALKRALASVAAAGGGYLFLPRGAYEISSTIYIPNGVQLIGLGWGNPPAYGQFGTVIQASGNFTGSALFPGNMMLAIDGQTDTYGAGASNLTLDCNNVPGCGGLYRGHANEQTYFRRITVLNFSSYGLYVCGAGENGDAPHVCGGTSNSGAQGDGPDEDLQFLPGTAANASTLAVVLRSVLSYRGLHDVTINTSSSAPNQPLYAGWLSGIGLNVRELHIEGPANGLLLGPQQGALCPKNCNGLTLGGFEQIDLTRGGGPAVILAGAYSITLANILPTLNYELNSQNTSSAGPVSWMAVDSHGTVMSNDRNFGSTAAASTSASKLTVASGATPQLIVQNTTGPLYPYAALSMGADGTLTLGGQAGTGDLKFTNRDGVIAMGSIAPYAGLNLQAPFEPATSWMRGAVCSNARWNSEAGGWLISNNGAADYGCLFFNGGDFAISSSNSVTEPTSLPQQQFNGNVRFRMTGTGDLILGLGALSAADSGQTLQVKGGIQLAATQPQPACNQTTRGTLWFLKGTSSQDHLQLCAMGPNNVLTWQSVF